MKHLIVVCVSSGRRAYVFPSEMVSAAICFLTRLLGTSPLGDGPGAPASSLPPPHSAQQRKIDRHPDPALSAPVSRVHGSRDFVGPSCVVRAVLANPRGPGSRAQMFRLLYERRKLFSSLLFDTCLPVSVELGEKRGIIIESLKTPGLSFSPGTMHGSVGDSGADPPPL